MRKKTLIQILLLLLLCSSLITACGEKENPDEKVIPESTIVEELLNSDEIEGEDTSSEPQTDASDEKLESDISVENQEDSASSSEETPTKEVAENELSESDDTSTESTETEQEPLVPSVKVKGIYVTGPIAGNERMQDLIDLVTSTELNTMVIDVKNDAGNLTYKMELPPEADLDAGIRYVKDMPALIQSLHEQGIYVIARIVCFKDPILAKEKPELALCLPDGKAVMDANGLAWVNPYKQEVWDYLCTLAECASRDGFDEIQFDYVRFPIGNDANNAEYGVDMNTYPREAGLTDFFKYVSERLHGQNIIFGADLFGTIIGSDVDRDRTGQNYSTIAKYTDAICPMIYPSHYANGTFGFDVPDKYPYDTISHALTLSHEELNDLDGQSEESALPHGVVRPWLQCFNAIWVDGHITYDSKEVHDQIQAVYDAGYDEWFLWHASNHYEQVEGALNDYEYKYPDTENTH